MTYTVTNMIEDLEALAANGYADAEVCCTGHGHPWRVISVYDDEDGFVGVEVTN